MAEVIHAGERWITLEEVARVIRIAPLEAAEFVAAQPGIRWIDRDGALYYCYLDVLKQMLRSQN